MPEADPRREAQETSDVSVRVVLISGGSLVLGVLVSLLLAASIWRGVGRATEAGPELAFQHGPDSTTGIATDWRAQDAAVRRHLDSYEWVDRSAGRVRIPIGRAMDLMVDDETGRGRP